MAIVILLKVCTVVRLGLQVTGSVALVADCGRISFQTVCRLMREMNLAVRASPAINATQCYGQLFFQNISSPIFEVHQNP